MSLDYYVTVEPSNGDNNTQCEKAYVQSTPDVTRDAQKRE